MVEGVAAFAEDVRARRYPEPEHGYTMAPDESARLRGLLAVGEGVGRPA
jgi:3-methyl-2-oxobutanoate hydroxymethyltransferase